MRLVLPCYSARQPPTCDKMPYFFQNQPPSTPITPLCLQYRPVSEQLCDDDAWNICAPPDIYYLYIPSLVNSSLTHVISQSFIFKLPYTSLLCVKSTPGQRWMPQNPGLTKFWQRQSQKQERPQSRSTLHFFALSSTPRRLFLSSIWPTFLCCFADITCTRSYSFDSFFVNITNAVQ